MNPVTIKDLAHFADILGSPKYILTRFVFAADSNYKEFRVKKKSGSGYRIISAPSSALKGLQRWITTHIIRRLDLPDACVGFRPGYSILNNAQQHVRQGFVLNLDIEDFFPSITVGRVVGLFRSIGYTKDVAFALGRLTTYKGRLPQGAPSSPDISNLICSRLDRRLAGFTRARRWQYTRYCDDMTISGPIGCSPFAVARMSEIVRAEGFKINASKTRITRANGRQLVTGLVVNRKPAIPRHKRRQLRALMHQATISPEKFASRYAEICGHVALLRMVNASDPLLRSGRAERALSALKSFCAENEASVATASKKRV